MISFNDEVIEEAEIVDEINNTIQQFKGAKITNVR